jgi:hypothetical protein
MHWKCQCISTLSHSYMFRSIRGAIFREFNMSLLNCCPMSWKRNGMRAVYCDCVCVWWDVMGWGLYIVTVVGCYGMRAVYCDCVCGGMLWDEGCILWLSLWWDVTGRWMRIRILRPVTSHHTDCHNIQPLSWHCATIQQAHPELPEDGASDAPKHVGVR